MPPSELPRTPRVAGRRRPIGAFIVLLALCLISFALGIFVGKHRQVVQQQTEPAQTHPVVRNAVTPQLEPESAVGVVAAAAEVVTQVASGSPQLVETQPKDEDAVPDEKVQSAAPVLSEKSPLGNGINKVDVPVVAPEPAPVVATQKVSVTPPQPVAKTAPAKVQPKVVSGAVKYVVQVGSFKKQSDAEKVKSRLQKTFAVEVRRADLGEKGLWYRVLVGPVSSSAEAAKIKDSLQQGFKLSGFVKRDSN